MIIGILETDTVDKNVRNEYGSYADMFQHLLLSVDQHLSFNVYRVIEDKYPNNIHECDAYLITGSQYSAYENELWIIKLREFIVTLDQQKIKLIGICFGHQIIAQALGGLVEKSEKGWGVGNTVAYIKQVPPWMGQESELFTLLYTHQDQVVFLPEQATRIARNNFCENASFHIKNHIFTFQGHPEFLPGYLVYLMNKRRESIGEEKYNLALNSLSHNVDAEQVSKWMVAFLDE